jgi:protein-glutamine gamma-glutamyltransferase
MRRPSPKSSSLLQKSSQRRAGTKWLVVDGREMWTLLATLPAYLAVWVVRAEIAWYPAYVWMLCIATTLTVVFVSKWFSALSKSSDSAERSDIPRVVLIVAAIPWIVHLAYRWIQYANAWNFQGEPLEILVLASLQNMTLAMALISRSAKNRRLTITMGFFLMLFAVVISSHNWVYPVALLYGIMAIWWLMGDHWERLQDGFVGQTRSSSLPMRGGVLVATLLLIGLAASVAIVVAPERVGLSGFLPTSGGKSWADPSARSGVGDGDMLVGARDNASSFGPVESDLFIEDKQPSLYDMISELDGLPPKKKKSEAAVGIDSKVGKTNHEKLATSEASSREFSTVRQAPKYDRKKLADKDSPSLIYYSGPVPQRLAVETFDQFDGVTWTNGETRNGSSTDDTSDVYSPIVEFATPSTQLITRSGKPWIYFRYPKREQQVTSAPKIDPPIPHPSWSSAIKIIRFVSTRIPTPDSLRCLHIDRIDRPEFFDWTQDGVVKMVDREQVPALTTVRLEAKQRDLHDLRNPEYFKSIALSSSAAIDINDLVNQRSNHNQTVANATRQIVAGLPRGWEQIEAIEGTLKHGFILDSQAVAPDDSTDPVEHFLMTKRGPAYLFATTAAIMVRSLGHDSRLANGFYIDSDSFDVASGQHLIGKKQLHWWPQVSIDGSNWISIEPTPGYSSPQEQWSLFQRAQWAWNVAARWVRNHPWMLIGSMLGIAIAYRKRLLLVDSVMKIIVAFMGRLSIEHRVAWSLWLMDKRAEWAGCPRPSSKTQRQWFQRMQFQTITSDSCKEPTAFDSMRYVLNAQDELLYSPCRNGSSKKSIRSQDLEILQQSLVKLNKLWTVQAMRSANILQQNDAPKSNRPHEYAPDYAAIH